MWEVLEVAAWLGGIGVFWTYMIIGALECRR